MSVIHEFANPFLERLKRAEKQLQAIVSESERILSTLNVKAENYIPTDRMSYEVKVSECGDLQDLSDLSMLVGECAHNIRSSLDNLVFALARLQEDPPSKPKRLSFPVYTNRSDFEGRGKPALTGLIEGGALKIIEALQPFQRANEPGGSAENDLLYAINEINNSDKHRMPISAVVNIPEASHVALTSFGSDELASMNVPPDYTMFTGPAKVGAILMSGRFKTPVVSMSGNFILKVELIIDVNGRSCGLVEMMSSSHLYVSNIIKLFAGRFDNLN